MKYRAGVGLLLLAMLFPLSITAENSADEASADVEQVEKPDPKPVAKPTPKPRPRSKTTDREFDPSEEISEDLSVPFPVDI
jgi:hypothetical protein